MDDLERARRAGEAIADLAVDPAGRLFLLEVAARLKPSVMDASRDQFEEAAARARHAVAAADEIARFHWSDEWPTLGEFVAALPEDVRERVGDHLWRAGLS
ncbi:hypothetical protein [Streptomyces canus]|uniref:hypothetical protein n=1 Tax=Streptomyces canus TaxID=58343 RepID=UPI0003638C74|nr:hypothetical protein [Streptomyces canus]